MTANRDLGRRLGDHFADEAPRRAPDWVLSSALTKIATTRQRRASVAPWGLSPHYARLGGVAAAVAVLVVAGLQLTPIGGPGPSSSPLASATSEPVTPGPTAYVPPALTLTYVSRINGLWIAYPAGWEATVDTNPWPPSSGTYREPLGDQLFDPARGDVFIKAASQSLAGATFDAWSAMVFEGRRCAGSPAPIMIDGAEGLVDSSCLTAVVASGGRGYLFVATWSDDRAELRSVDWAGWFRDVLATVQLRPEDALEGPNPTLVPGSTLGPSVELTLTAKDIAFGDLSLDAPANAPIVIQFTNADVPGILHVVDLRRSDGSTVVREQDAIDGGTSAEYEFDALPPGTYLFTCRIHPIPSMTGTLRVR